MIRWFALATVGVVMVFAGQAHGQEVSCRRFFMNASEKRICATPELMQLDQKMGELARRVELHQDGFKSDQRQFRKAVKTCDGDVPCLAKSYDIRISELQAVATVLPPPTADETVYLRKEAEKAEEKFAAQADGRARWAKKLAQKDAAASSPTSQLAQAPITEAPITALASGSEPDITVAKPEEASLPTPEVVETKQVEAPAPPAVASAPAQTTATDPPEQSTTSSDDNTLMVQLALGVGALMVIVWIRRALLRLFKVCPRCKKWGAGVVVDRNQSSYTDYEMRTHTDQHRDSRGINTGSTVRQRQVAVRVTDTVDTLQCRVCNHVWDLSSQHRSG